MNIEKLLIEQIAIALNTLFEQNIAPQTLALQPTKKEFEGDLTFVVFPYTKISKKSPEETATLIGDFLAKENTVVEKYNIVKGFLNFVIKPQVWIKLLSEFAQTSNFGQQKLNGKKVMVEYSSPNTNKPLHLGHLRNNFLGFAVSNILGANGYEVLKANLVNDRGIHICKSMLAYQKFGHGETPISANVKGDKLVGNYYVRFEQENKKELARIEAYVNQFNNHYNEIIGNWVNTKEIDYVIQESNINFDKPHLSELIIIDTILSIFSYIQPAKTSEKFRGKLRTRLKQKTAEFRNGKQEIKTNKELFEKLFEEAKLNTPLAIEVREMLENWEKGRIYVNTGQNPFSQKDKVDRLKRVKKVYDSWEEMNGWVYDGFDETYKTIGVKFDKFYYESDTYLLGKDIIDEGLAKKIFYKKADKSVWIDLTADGLDHKLVLRGNGTSVYITQDMGTADLKYVDFPMQKSIYVIGNEQDYHMKVLKLIMQKLQRPYADGMHHLSYGMVELPSGKMKSREGTVVDADDLVQELIELAQETTKELGKVQELGDTEKQNLYNILGLGALKYFLLKVDPKKTMLFNPEESLQLNGDTATYIQYTYARTATVLREAALQKIDYSHLVWENETVLHEIEQGLIQHLSQYPTVLHHAAENLSPALVGAYCYDLAKLYGRFFHDLSIFKAETTTLRAFRLAMSAEVGKILKHAMGLLGITMPERM